MGKNLGIEVTASKQVMRTSSVTKSAKLSFEAFVPTDIKARKIAVLVHDKVNQASIDAIQKWAEAEHAVAHILTPTPAPVINHQHGKVTSNGMQKAEPSIAYDAVIVVDGDNDAEVKQDGVTKHYILEAYKHLKPIVFLGTKKNLLEALQLVQDDGTLISDHFEQLQDQFKDLIRHHRIWAREKAAEAIPA